MNLRRAAVCVLLVFSCTTVLIVSAADTNEITGLARCTTPVARDGKAYERFLELNKRANETGTNAQLIFVGDSITQGWEANGKAVWEKYYAPYHALNLGIGSDHTQHVLWRLEHGNVDGLKPEVAVVLIGVNNIPDERNSVSDVLAGVTSVVKTLRQKLPNTKVLVLGILPFREDFNLQRGKALQINQALYRLADQRNIFFLDIGYLLIQSSGKISKDIMRDFLHPTAEGYRIWAEAMEPKLRELMSK
jgi:beta-glucosidase